MDKYLNAVVATTETFLTWRARRRWTRKQKQKQKNVILDWVEAFVWSACVVLLVNQYAFQAYEIPSPSMEKTLLVQDRIFVNKFQFGPELLPGLFKLPGITIPERGDIIIFENPAYISPMNAMGPAMVTLFDVAQRLIYMMTLSLVDIDREADGQPKAHFLVKRGIGYSGDVVRWRQGEPEFQLPGTSVWVKETDLKAGQGLSYGQHRLAPDSLPAYYQVLPGAARALVANIYGKTASPSDSQDLKAIDALNANNDEFEKERQVNKAILAIYPQATEKASKYFQSEIGTWIPEGYILPIGDNRDNSKDGRYFGPVPLKEILGEASFRYWPLGRAGGL